MLKNKNYCFQFKLDGENVEAYGTIIAKGKLEGYYTVEETCVPEEIVDLKFDEFYSLDKDEIEGELALDYLPRLQNDKEFYDKVCKAILESDNIYFELDRYY